MRNPERIGLMLFEVQRIWMAHPDQRLGQLMFNLYSEFAGRDTTCCWWCGTRLPNCYDYFHIEDDAFYEFLHTYGRN